MKLVYYPSFFRLQAPRRRTSRWSPSTLVVFVATWVLHSYQWFWLRGGFPLAAAGRAVLGRARRARGHRRAARDRSARPQARSSAAAPRRGALSLALRTAAHVLVRSARCGRCGAPSRVIGVAVDVARGRAASTPGDAVAVADLSGRHSAIGGQRLGGSASRGRRCRVCSRSRRSATARCWSALIALAQRGALRGRAPRLARAVERAADARRSTRATPALQHQGYYEKLDSTRAASARRSADVAGAEAGGTGSDSSTAGSLPRARTTSCSDDLRSSRSIASWTSRSAPTRGACATGSTRRRSRRAPPHRAARTVARDGHRRRGRRDVRGLVEERLNAADGRRDSERYEVLNFGVDGYSLLAAAGDARGSRVRISARHRHRHALSARRFATSSAS